MSIRTRKSKKIKLGRFHSVPEAEQYASHYSLHHMPATKSEDEPPPRFFTRKIQGTKEGKKRIEAYFLV